MNLITLLAIAASLAAVGAFITVSLARRIPLDVLDLAQRHGRFAHLGVQDGRNGPTRASRVSKPAAAHANGLHPA